MSEQATQVGHAAPKKGHAVALRLPEDEHSRLAALARGNLRSVSAETRVAVRAHLAASASG